MLNVCPGGGCVQGAVCMSGVGVRTPPLLPEADTPCGQTEACENITLLQTSFKGGKYLFCVEPSVAMSAIDKEFSVNGILLCTIVVIPWD